MPIIEYDTYKQKLGAMGPKLETLAAALDLEGAERELDMLQAESAADGFWDNLAKAQKVQQRIKNLQDKVGRPDGPVRDGQRVRGRIPPARAGGGFYCPGGQHGAGPASDPADRGV